MEFAMKIGKVPENVLKRSVFKQIHTKRPEVVLGAGVGEDCAAVMLAEDETLVLSTDPITVTAQDIGTLAIQITANDLASAGAEPVGVLLTVLLPPEIEEPDLREMMQQVEAACAKAGVQVMGGHTEITAVVNQPVNNVCGVGKVKDGCLISTGGALHHFKGKRKRSFNKIFCTIYRKCEKTGCIFIRAFRGCSRRSVWR